jgi:hypothetical protein
LRKFHPDWRDPRTLFGFKSVLGYLGLSLGNICGFFSSIGRVFDRTVNLPHFIQLAVENNGLNNSRSEGEEEQDYSSPFSTGAPVIRAAALVAIGISLAGLGVYKSRDIGGWAVPTAPSGAPFTVAGTLIVLVCIFGWKF